MGSTPSSSPKFAPSSCPSQTYTHLKRQQLANLHVVGIAGAGCEHALSYGADEIIDYRYHSPDSLAAAIMLSGRGRIRHVFDCISEGGTLGSLEPISTALKARGGKVTYVLTYSPAELAKVPKNVEMIRTLVGTAHNGDEEFAREWFARLGIWMEEGKFRGQKVTVVSGGLGGVEEGLRRLKEGKVSCEKLVYSIAETEGIAA